MRWPPKDQLVIGLHAIRELLLHAPDRLIRILTVPPKGSRKSEILESCEKKGIPISFCSENDLTKMSDSDSHQNIAAQVKGRKYYDAKEFIEESGETSFVLMLDQIFDPQNFGAILRTAEAFGVDGVAWSKNRGSDLTPTVAKTSCGASELIRLIRISNLADAVLKFQEAGYEIVASLLEPSSESAFTFRYAPKSVLILGSEGEGIQPLIRKKADRSIYIPMSGKIESLNVAQAASVLLALKNAR